MSNPYDTGRFAKVTGMDEITSASDAARIVKQMVDDLQQHPTEWENGTLERFLEALSRSLRGLEGLYLNRGEPFPDPPTWTMFTEALVMASGYE